MATAASRARSSILVSVCAGCFLLLCLSRDAAASPLSFSFDFSNKSTFGSRIQVMGDALQQDNLVDLTVDTSYRRGIHYLKGRMSYVDPVPFFDTTTHELTSFVTHFTFAIKPIQGEIRGDGMAFFLSSFPPTVPANSTGGNLGLIVQGDGNALGVDRFVAIVFKTFNNSDHIGIDINSALSSKNETALPDFSLNGSMTACITFNGTTGMIDASLQFNDNRSLGPFKVSYQLPDPTSLLPPGVAVGFSAGTGDYSERHQIMSWSFTTTLPQRKGLQSKTLRSMATRGPDPSLHIVCQSITNFILKTTNMSNTLILQRLIMYLISCTNYEFSDLFASLA
uniref:Agglutinin-2 n=1 Tax=Aegilops tauschii TaxID=37682 RepID=M8BB37_AEGTA